MREFMADNGEDGTIEVLPLVVMTWMVRFLLKGGMEL